MCNPRAALRVVWCGPRGIVHDLEMPFQMNYIPHFVVPLISQYLPQPFAFDQRFAALQVHEQGPATFLIT